jgi:hypothetical protein
MSDHLISAYWLLLGRFAKMRRNCIVFLCLVFSFSALGRERQVFWQKTENSSTASKNLSDNFSSCSKPFHSELELFSGQRSVVSKANDRIHSLAAFLVAGSSLNKLILFYPGIEEGYEHFSHKSYLLHIYPYHNFW